MRPLGARLALWEQDLLFETNLTLFVAVSGELWATINFSMDSPMSKHSNPFMSTTLSSLIMRRRPITCVSTARSTADRSPLMAS